MTRLAVTDAIIFTGPTLAARDAGEVLQADYMPPAAQGDIYRATLRHPAAIGIVDGYFERVPAVWHKEILWAMQQGIHVFGAASTGALRAAELASFGMVGVGRIFESYLDGSLEDDDEVAIAHASAEDGYRGSSDPMVNIRATLLAAQRDQVIGRDSAARLERIAKELFYADRSYARLLELATEQGLPGEELDAFRNWLPAGAVNRKREDALELLRTMKQFLESGPGRKTVTYAFEDTFWWNTLKRLSREETLPGRDADAVVLLELQSDPALLSQTKSGALGWWLAAERARRDGYTVDVAALLEQSGQFSKFHGLTNMAEMDQWLERNHCGRPQLENLLELRALAARAEWSAGHDLENLLLQYLRSTGYYTTLLSRSEISR